MEKILIKETKKCDTRTGESNFDKADVDKETDLHIQAVNKCGEFICDKISEQFANHDFTKNSTPEYLDAFTKALKTGFKGKEFHELDWWEIHKNKERHHLKDRVPDDVNLIDVLEMVCDCVSAGLARTGEVYDVDLDGKILEKAFKNTADLLIKNIKVIK